MLHWKRIVLCVMNRLIPNFPTALVHSRRDALAMAMTSRASFLIRYRLRTRNVNHINEPIIAKDNNVVSRSCRVVVIIDDKLTLNEVGFIQ